MELQADVLLMCHTGTSNTAKEIMSNQVRLRHILIISEKLHSATPNESSTFELPWMLPC